MTNREVWFEMVTTVSYDEDPRYVTHTGEGYDGVVRVSYGGYYGTGVLLYDGHAILTAAHLFDERSGTTGVTFETQSGIQTLGAAKVLLHPGYDSEGNNDLAIVWLDRSAPGSAPTATRSTAKATMVGQEFTAVGYGRTAQGIPAPSRTTQTMFVSRPGNRFDRGCLDTQSYLGSSMAWMPTPGTQLVADFDNGKAPTTHWAS